LFLPERRLKEKFEDIIEIPFKNQFNESQKE
jgi:hypothetical protein